MAEVIGVAWARRSAYGKLVSSYIISMLGPNELEYQQLDHSRNPSCRPARSPSLQLQEQELLQEAKLRTQEALQQFRLVHRGWWARKLRQPQGWLRRQFQKKVQLPILSSVIGPKIQ